VAAPLEIGILGPARPNAGIGAQAFYQERP
jgi:hypothetical protein